MATIVTRDNFIRAETDQYFASFVRDGGLGELHHNRNLADLDHQTVVRMNRDTIYSNGVFDLDAGPVSVVLPDARGRFMSVLVVDEDHYVVETFYDRAPHRFTREQAVTRYIALLVRTFVDPADPTDIAKVHALQNSIKIDQPGGPGIFEVPEWDQASLTSVRNSLKAEVGTQSTRAFGTRAETDPQEHLVGTAVGWGGNPSRDATYLIGKIPNNDGKQAYRLTVKDVPVDGFWSVSVYNRDGYFEKNSEGAYSYNNITATKDADGGVIVQFGGCDSGVPNCLPITPGWNYTVRLYRPRAEITDGQWEFPHPIAI